MEILWLLEVAAAMKCSNPYSPVALPSDVIPHYGGGNNTVVAIIAAQIQAEHCNTAVSGIYAASAKLAKPLLSIRRRGTKQAIAARISAKPRVSGV